MSRGYYITRRGLAALRKKQQELIEELESSTRAMGRSASLDADLRENPEFMQLRTKVTYEIPNKIADVDAAARNAQLIEETEYLRAGDFQEILPGAEVMLSSDSGEIRVYSILGYEEGDPDKGVLSYLSPIGERLLHKGVGDEVELFSKGKTIVYEIMEIKRSPYL